LFRKSGNVEATFPPDAGFTIWAIFAQNGIRIARLRPGVQVSADRASPNPCLQSPKQRFGQFLLKTPLEIGQQNNSIDKGIHFHWESYFYLYRSTGEFIHTTQTHAIGRKSNHIGRHLPD
jgi:hypothetical protein